MILFSRRPFRVAASLLALHATPLTASPVVGRIGDVEITAEELRENLSGIEKAAGGEIPRDPASLTRYVRALLLQRQILKMALDQKWDQEPAVIAALVRARESALTESFLQSKSAPDPGFPDESAIADAYAAAKDQLAVPRTYLVAQIFIEGDRKKLDRVAKQLANPKADFAGIARAESDDPSSASRGGEIGWLTEEQVQPEIRPHLTKLKLQQVSTALPMKKGWHFIKLLDIREPHTPPLAQVRNQLASRLREDDARRRRQAFLDTLLREHPAAINEIEIGKIAPPPSSAPQP